MVSAGRTKNTAKDVRRQNRRADKRFLTGEWKKRRGYAAAEIRSGRVKRTKNQ